MKEWRIVDTIAKVDLGLFIARGPAAAVRLAERACKVRPGQPGLEVTLSGGSLKLSPTQHDAIHAIVAKYDEAVAGERARWGDASADRLAAKGINAAEAGEIAHKTILAIEALGLITRSSSVQTFGERLRKGSWGHRLGGTVTDRYVAHVVKPTRAAREYVARNPPASTLAAAELVRAHNLNVPLREGHAGHVTLMWRLLLPSLASMDEFEVDEDHRRHGLGTSAYAAWERRLPRAVRQVVLVANGPGAREFWKEQGFALLFRDNDPASDEQWMAKAIRGPGVATRGTKGRR